MLMGHVFSFKQSYPSTPNIICFKNTVEVFKESRRNCSELGTYNDP